MDNSQQAVAIFDKYATQYQTKFIGLEQFRDSFELFCNSIAASNATILELACGPGNITHYLLQYRPDFQLLGTDLSENMLALARERNPSANFELLDCRLIQQLGKQFDGILLGFGLPYLTKAEALQFIKDAATCLVPNGVLYISTMEADNNSSAFKTGSTGDSIFINYHEAGYLKQALQQNGFTMISELRKPYPEADGSITTDLVLIARLEENLPE